MMPENHLNIDITPNRRGIVLMVTLVMLVVLSTLAYTLTTRVASQRHRDRYLVNYGKARYACDSAVKYAFAMLEDINEPQLVARPNEPDFSDLFILTEAEYKELLAKWAAQMAENYSKKYAVAEEEQEEENYTFKAKQATPNDMNENSVVLADINDVNDVNDIIEADRIGPGGINDVNDPNILKIPGPYGPAWPFIIEPIEFKIGSASVKIEIEDENAKYPLAWMLLDNKQNAREVHAGFVTFCEWMDFNEVEIGSLERQLKQISELKQFNLVTKPATKTERKMIQASGGRRRRRRPRYTTVTKTISVLEQATKQSTDLARLFHSSLIDTDLLAKPMILSDSRRESALKYLGLWGSGKVNINSAPRHVLEAAFAFGGDAKNIAEKIIETRRLKPFEDIDDLKKSLFRYSDSIDKCGNYITTVSGFFTIRVTATSGVARTSTVIAIMKDGEQVQQVAVMSG